MRFLSSHIDRNPIPDYYSITLEISRDRTTAAEELLCSSQDPSKVSCPPSHSSSDLYLHRTLNDACQKMVSPSLSEWPHALLGRTVQLPVTVKSDNL